MPRTKMPSKITGDPSKDAAGRRQPEADSDDFGKLITYQEAAELLACSRRTVGRRIANGQYLAYGEGPGRRVLYHSILADIRRACGEPT